MGQTQGYAAMKMAGLAAVVLVAIGPQAWAQSDIVWPTYDRAALVTDPQLNCDVLGAEIAHVSSDIRLLEAAKSRVVDALHSAFDLERYGGHNGPGGMRVTAGGVGGKEGFAAAREQIVASLKIAQERRLRLKGLEPGCKPAPQPISTP